jgi:23S rRNA (uridine2552-2'-O)-methyltransferase
VPQAREPGNNLCLSATARVVYRVSVANYVPKDSAYRAARQAGYRSRAALKLVEIDRKFRFLRSGMRVVDLGCWPGGWLQVASSAVGPAGVVVGVDLDTVADLGLANVTTLVGDVCSRETIDAVRAQLGGPADVVLSDLAPKLTGIRDVDRVRQLGLCETALDFCSKVLSPRGAFLMKVFSDSEREASVPLRARFLAVSAYRPDTTRKGSSEIYCFCTEHRA